MRIEAEPLKMKRKEDWLSWLIVAVVRFLAFVEGWPRRYAAKQEIQQRAELAGYKIVAAATLRNKEKLHRMSVDSLRYRTFDYEGYREVGITVDLMRITHRDLLLGPADTEQLMQFKCLAFVATMQPNNNYTFTKVMETISKVTEKYGLEGVVTAYAM